MTCIILNIVTMAISYESASEEYIGVLISINWMFTIIFMGEAVLKITAYGF